MLKRMLLQRMMLKRMLLKRMMLKRMLLKRMLLKRMMLVAMQRITPASGHRRGARGVRRGGEARGRTCLSCMRKSSKEPYLPQHPTSRT
jgi:hypothetical protein